LTVVPQKSGYNFTLGAGSSGAGPNDCMARATNSGYLTTGVPQTFGSTGTRSFAVNAGNTIWQNTGAAAPTEPFTVSATVAPVQ